MSETLSGKAVQPCLRGLAPVFLLAVILLALPILLPAAAWSGDKVNQRERIMAAITRDGHAKVLVRLKSPALLPFAPNGPAEALKGSALNGDGGERGIDVRRSVADALSHVVHRARHSFRVLPFLALDVSADALALLEGHPDVAAIAEDRLRPIGDGARTSAALVGPSVGPGAVAAPQAYPQNADAVGASQAWSERYTGQGWYVAVVDTGVLASHEMFAGKDVVEACFSAVGDCPNGRNEMFGPGAARPRDKIYDGYEHGTHVSGIAVGNNGRNFGVAKDANLIAIQVFTRFSARECGGVPCLLSYDSDQIAALDYVYSIRSSYKIASVNMSLGGGAYASQAFCDLDNRDIKTAIDNLRSAGIPTVVAGGNSGSCGSLEAPACISSAVAVGAVDDGDAELAFNNWHYGMLDLLAPGRNIYSAVPDSTTSYDSMSGTSMATPHVAGAWAILKQKSPGASVDEVLEALASTGAPVRTVCMSIDDFKPRIQVNAALSPATVPVPARVEASSYAPTASPVLNVSHLMPLGVGSVAGTGDSVDIQVGFYKFSETVDIYLGIAAPVIDPANIYLVLPGNRVQPLSGGLVPWKSGVTGPVGESLFGEIPVFSFPPGVYRFYLAVTPAGRADRSAIWSTEFSVP